MLSTYLETWMNVLKNHTTEMQNYQKKRKNRVERIISVAERNAWKYHLSFPPLKWAAHKSMWAMSKVVPNRMVRHFDWIYRYDVTLEG